MAAHSLQTEKATRGISVKFVSITTAALAFYGFNFSPKRVMFSFKIQEHIYFLKPIQMLVSLQQMFGGFWVGRWESQVKCPMHL